jgi:hypothetical protein
MRKIVAVATFATMTMLGMIAAGAGHSRTHPWADGLRHYAPLTEQPAENVAGGPPGGSADQTSEESREAPAGEPGRAPVETQAEEPAQQQPEQQAQQQPEQPSTPGKGEGGAMPVQPQEVSKGQYKVLFGQCRYANTPRARAQCRAMVQQKYRIGARNPFLDCRAYSGITVCGELMLSPAEQACVTESVKSGLTYRRAEVECYAFR